MAEKKEVLMEAKDILKILPHRYPFLMLDKMIRLEFPRADMTQIEPGFKAVGIKNVAFNETFFQGHFPGNPIMPGVMILEAMAQCACCAGLMLKDNHGKLGLFTGVEELKYRRQVLPGDVLLLEAEFIAFKRGMGKAHVRATVDGAVAAEGILKFAIVSPENKSENP